MILFDLFSAPAKRKRSSSHSTSKKLKQSDNTDDDQLGRSFKVSHTQLLNYNICIYR